MPICKSCGYTFTRRHDGQHTCLSCQIMDDTFGGGSRAINGSVLKHSSPAVAMTEPAADYDFEDQADTMAREAIDRFRQLPGGLQYFRDETRLHELIRGAFLKGIQCGLETAMDVAKVNV